MEKAGKQKRHSVSNSYLERRKYPRFLLSLPMEYQHGRRVSRGCTLNASNGGILVDVPERLNAGKNVRVKIFLFPAPDKTNAAVNIEAQVVWVKHLKKNRKYLSGMRFIGDSEEYIDGLGTFLSSLSNPGISEQK